MTHSFWTEGPERLREALYERRAEVGALAEQIKATRDAADRAGLEKKLERLMEEYTPSADEIDECLFLLR